MNLWRLEVLRLLRTNRLLIVVGVYLFFGAMGPLTARYIRQILERFGGGIQIQVPDPVPPDGIAQFNANAGQLGLLAVVVVAASALAIDAHPEISTFLRTRVQRVSDLVIPRVTMSAVAAIVALVLGTSTAWVLTEVLLGSLDVGAMLLGLVFGALYLVFTVAVVAAVGTSTRTVLGAVLGSVGVLLLLPVLGLFPFLEPWLPSELLGAIDLLLLGVSASEFVRATITTLLASAALIALAVSRATRREL